MDVTFGLLGLLFRALHKLVTYLQFPESIVELCDPIYFPPAFNSPHTVTSLADFWGKAWHTVFKRIFLVGGGKPAVWIAKKLGASPRNQRLVGLFGVYAASAIFHEYFIWVIAQAPHPRPHTFTSFPGTGLFFMIQPFALLMEPFIIPKIPKSVGGGRLWVWGFLVLSSYSFRAQVLDKGGMVKTHLPLSQWSWMYIISPIKW
jgi:hypothetical protein